MVRRGEGDLLRTRIRLSYLPVVLLITLASAAVGDLCPRDNPACPVTDEVDEAAETAQERYRQLERIVLEVVSENPIIRCDASITLQRDRKSFFFVVVQGISSAGCTNANQIQCSNRVTTLFNWTPGELSAERGAIYYGERCGDPEELPFYHTPWIYAQQMSPTTTHVAVTALPPSLGKEAYAHYEGLA